MTANESSWADENVLQLDSGDGYTTTGMYEVSLMVNCILYVLYHNEKKVKKPYR